MIVLTAIREVQIPLLAAMQLGACGTKLARVLRVGSISEAFGPTALFPVRMRRPLVVGLCIAEFTLGLGLILTAGRIGAGSPATAVRLASGLLFIVATCALVELRASRPDVGCGCFGDFSTAPVSLRTLARSALLAVAALATVGLPPIEPPLSAADAARLVGILFVELLVIGALSPEIGEGLVRLGYSEPCELQVVPSQRTLAALRRSKQWRRYAMLMTSDEPADIWRELCWRYVVYPASYAGRPADLVFAVFLQYRRPAIRAALVDADTGQTLPWPPAHATHGRLRLRLRPVPVAANAAPLTASIVPVGAAVPAGPVRADLPVSTDI